MVRALLNSWGVDEDTIAVFLENKITVDDLPHLSAEDLKSLVPLIGPRNRIKIKIESLKPEECQESPGSSGSSGGIDLNENQLGLLKDIVDSSAAGDERGSEMERSDDDGPLPGDDAAETSKKSKVQRRRREVGAVDLRSSEDYDLNAVIKSAGGPGQLILDTYKSKQHLTDTTRSSLAKIILCRETANNLDARLSKERAKFIATLIVKLFPKELLSTWYRIETRPNGNGKVIKGKLMRRFYTQRRNFKKMGAILSNSDSEEEDIDDELESDEDISDSVKESLLWLQNKNVHPWTRVISTWTATSRKRIRELQQPVRIEQPGGSEKAGEKKNQMIKRKVRTTNEKVESYTQQYPQILEPQGWTLLEIDFEIYQKDSLLKLDLEYENFEKFVLWHLRELNHNLVFDDFQKKSKSERSAYVFMSLCKLFPVKTIASSGRNEPTWRPSRQEMRDTFLLHVKGYGDMKTVLEARKLKLQKFGLTDQPLPIIVGPLEKIERCLVKFDSCEYIVESPLKAIDVAFKSFHALHATYPAESEPMWLFLQKGIYKFKTKWDRHFDSVENVVQTYANFKE